MAIKISRRAMLTGIGGAAIGLPLLEAMVDNTGKAYSGGATNPQRFILCFDGQSLGADGDPIHNMYVPDTVGADYDLPRALAPLAGYDNIADEVTVVSGLSIPSANGGAIPIGGRGDDFHIKALSPLISGMRSSPDNYNVQGPTADQIVGDEIGGGTLFRTLTCRVQADFYKPGYTPAGRESISYRLHPDGSLERIQPRVSPKATFDAMFAGFVPEDPAEAARREFLLRQRKSVLDLVRGRYEGLLPRLGSSDKQRLDRHLQEIRELEIRVGQITETGGQCQMLPDPGTDPAVGTGQDSAGGADFDVNLSYSDEETRALAMVDLVHMAIVCDMTRSATLMFTMLQSHLNMNPLTGVPWDLHEIGHSGSLGTQNMSDAIAWHIGHFARLLAKLRDTPEGNGNVLDNCAVLMLHEGGHGYDPAAGAMNSSHSTENMACLIAGRAGGLNPGRHVVAPAGSDHPVNVINSAMQAVGVSQTLGEVTGGVIPALFV